MLPGSRDKCGLDMAPQRWEDGSWTPIFIAWSTMHQTHQTHQTRSSQASIRLCVSANRGTGRGSQRSKQNPPGDSCRAHPPISPVAPRQGCGGQGQPWVSHNDVNVSPMAAILTMIQETVESMVHLSYIISYFYFVLQHVTTIWSQGLPTTRCENLGASDRSGPPGPQWHLSEVVSFQGHLHAVASKASKAGFDGI